MSEISLLLEHIKQNMSTFLEKYCSFQESPLVIVLLKKHTLDKKEFSMIVRLCNIKKNWQQRKRLDLARQQAVFKHRVFNKKELAPAFNIVLAKNLNVACVINKTQNTLFIYIHDAVCGVGYAVPSHWIRSIRYYTACRTIRVQCIDSQPFMHIMFSEILKITRSFHLFFIARLRMRGRLYRIYKRNRYRDLHYRIGFSHRITIYIEGFYARYIRKKKIRLFGYDFFALTKKAKEIVEAYPVCKYTQRGVRQSGKATFLKIGKTAKYY